jgi:hypothetical protein
MALGKLPAAYSTHQKRTGHEHQNSSLLAARLGVQGRNLMNNLLERKRLESPSVMLDSQAVSYDPPPASQ